MVNGGHKAEFDNSHRCRSAHKHIYRVIHTSHRFCSRGNILVFGSRSLRIDWINMCMFLVVLHNFHRSGMEVDRQVECNSVPSNHWNTHKNSDSCRFPHFDSEGHRQVLSNQCQCIHHSRYTDWVLYNIHGGTEDCNVEFGRNCLHIPMDICKDLELCKFHRFDNCILVVNNHFLYIQGNISLRTYNTHEQHCDDGCSIFPTTTTCNRNRPGSCSKPAQVE